MNSFTIYKEYYDLITLLSEKEQQEILLAITRYMFEDIEPTLNDKQMKVFNNLKRPLDKSKKRSKAGSNDNQIEIKEETKQNQNEIKTKSNENQNNNQNEIEKTNTSKMSMSMYIVNGNVNDLEKDNRGMGEEEKDNNSSTYREIINYLNERVGTQYRATSKENQKHIKARLNEGYSIDDFKQVIDNMAFKWLNDEKMNRYLRPETLFGTKFESYLNEVPKQKIPKTLKDVSMADIDRMIEIERSRNNDSNRIPKGNENDNNIL